MRGHPRELHHYFPRRGENLPWTNETAKRVAATPPPHWQFSGCHPRPSEVIKIHVQRAPVESFHGCQAVSAFRFAAALRSPVPSFFSSISCISWFASGLPFLIQVPSLSFQVSVYGKFCAVCAFSRPGIFPFPLSALLQLSGLQFQVFFRVFRVFRGLPPVFRFSLSACGPRRRGVAFPHELSDR